MAGYGGIWRDMAGYGGIWRDMAGYDVVFSRKVRDSTLGGTSAMNSSVLLSLCVYVWLLEFVKGSHVITPPAV